MCTNYRVEPDLDFISRAAAATLTGPFVWNDVIRPTDPAPVVAADHGERLLGPMAFSLVPSWSKERRPKFATHNARLETVATKATWRESLQRRRCVVPVSQFIEPIYDGEFAGNMVRFSERQGGLLFAAGIWDTWRDRSSDEVMRSFAIITDEPSAFVATTGHDRQPLFVEPRAIGEWLAGGAREADELLEVLQAIGASPEWAASIERPMASGWERRRKKRP